MVSADTTATTDPTTGSTGDATTTDSSGSSGPIPIMCGDTMVAPGELCLDSEVVQANGSIVSARLGDVFNDEPDDILYIAGGQLIVRPSMGNGNFAGPVSSLMVPSNNFITTDLDGNELLDLAAHQDNGSVASMRGQGDANFDVHDTLPATDTPQGVVTGDLDGDGDLDVIAAAGLADPSLYVGINNGQGQLTAQPAVTASGVVNGLAVDDFNGDGNLDVAFGVDGVGWQGIAIRPGDGAGGFGTQELTEQVVGVVDIASGDFDGNGFPDLASISVANNSLMLTLRSKDGTIAVETISTDGGPRVLLAADLDADGADELIVGDDVGDSIRIYELDDRLTLVLTEDVSVADAVVDLDTGDVNNDGALDVAATVITNNPASDLVVMLISNP